MSEKSDVSNERSIVDADDESAGGESPSESRSPSPDSFFLREVRDKLRDAWGRNLMGETPVRRGFFRSDRSSMIPSKSLARSAFSAKFARYETRPSRSASVLDAMPRMSCFRRRNRDRCLPCMHESLRMADEAGTTTDIDARSESGRSLGLAEFHVEPREAVSFERRRTVARSHEEEGIEEEVSGRAANEGEDRDAIATTVESKPAASKPTETLSRSPSKIAQAATAASRQSRISLSEAHTSDEEASSFAPDDDEPSGYRNTAPCHLPTVLSPDMEALRALKQRQPTTMEARIAVAESATSAKRRSDGECRLEEGTSKDESRQSAAVRQDAGERKGPPRVLSKVKTERTISSFAKGELRRGYSCASVVDLPKGSAGGTFEAPRSEEAAGEGGRVVAETSKDSVLPSGPTEAFLREAIRANESAASALKALAGEFSRLTERRDADDANASRRAKLAARLAELLADSKRYVCPDRFPSDLVFSAKQPPVCNSRLLRRVLPLDSYNLVAPLLGMPVWYPKRYEKRARTATAVRYEDEETEDSEIPFDLVVSRVRVPTYVCPARRGIFNSETSPDFISRL